MLRTSPLAKKHQNSTAHYLLCLIKKSLRNWLLVSLKIMLTRWYHVILPVIVGMHNRNRKNKHNHVSYLAALTNKLLGCFKLLILNPDRCVLAMKSAEGDKSSKVAAYAGDLYPSSVQLSEGLLTYREGSISLPVIAIAILLTGKKGNPKNPKKSACSSSSDVYSSCTICSCFAESGTR